MRREFTCVIALALSLLAAAPATAATIYNNSMAMISRPASAGTEAEAADDFFLTSAVSLTGASFVGLLQPGASLPSISEVVVEIYRVFPNDSNTVRTPAVPTRNNSPSDVEFVGRDSAVSGELTFTSTMLNATFTALNSVQAGGIHKSPSQTTNGNGPVTGQEVQVNVTFTTPINLPADHYFFIPQVGLTNAGTFYFLSAARPISGAGTTPFTPDLQAWIRDANLDPDWLRVGTDIVGGSTPPTFNAAFSLVGNEVPEPLSAALALAGLALIAGLRRRSLKA